jgi:hypothetical protein
MIPPITRELLGSVRACEGGLRRFAVATRRRGFVIKFDGTEADFIAQNFCTSDIKWAMKALLPLCVYASAVIYIGTKLNIRAEKKDYHEPGNIYAKVWAAAFCAAYREYYRE